ncbi:hypothetical protein TNCV_3841071 [Trichonephila clavipes]|nr:hypothetical protein TNCV_3841071 [Trichonephila clavipes]
MFSKINPISDSNGLEERISCCRLTEYARISIMNIGHYTYWTVHYWLNRNSDDRASPVEGILKSHSLSSLLNFLRAFGDGPVAGVSGGQGIEHGWHVSSSSPVPQKTRRVGQRCTLNLSRAEMSSRWWGVVVRRGGASSGVALVI